MPELSEKHLLFSFIIREKSQSESRKIPCYFVIIGFKFVQENNLNFKIMSDERDLPIRGSMPVGTIVAFAGEYNRIPAGWHECDGSPMSKDSFLELFQAIGTVWGGSGTPTFYLPDLRGMFLRGVSGESDNDPDKTLRNSPRNDTEQNPGNRGNLVGSIQQDAFQGHHHDKSWSNGSPSYGGPNNTDGGNERNGHFITDLTITNPINDGTNGIPRTAKETRAKNAYVYYIIKVIK
jgi:hypothetical protein